MSRPICVHCGKLYGMRAVKSEQVRWPIGQDMPPYRGNGVLVRTSDPHKTVNRDTVRSVTALSVNPEIRAAQEAQIARAPEESQMVATRWVWDGVSWSGGYSPFCKLRCALDFARKALDARTLVIQSNMIGTGEPSVTISRKSYDALRALIPPIPPRRTK